MRIERVGVIREHPRVEVQVTKPNPDEAPADGSKYVVRLSWDHGNGYEDLTALEWMDVDRFIQEEAERL